MNRKLEDLGFYQVNNYFEKKINDLTIIVVPISSTTVIRRINRGEATLHIQKMDLQQLELDEVLKAMLSYRNTSASGQPIIIKGTTKPTEQPTISFGKIVDGVKIIFKGEE